ncbi:F0F1 ATP synthase subunit B [Paraburkholderia sp. CNPSo 3274]|uniref:F0F1 ATP synthase subunit B family protein n=1 Tax=Paraburkholderia sp. CNPSo 3274 TaxID=2940932 RepID=UPI0020B7758D|nr:F0F1 ATP synthase subunit B [Paraburkholderia sp. CNPSo 3274]MCP3710088.1 F0F1 ATP synthase subunit B [Paraburkholderia sp. CNPSo 3274]
MHIDWSTLALQTVNALVLVWLLARFLFRPVADIVAARQKAAQALLEDAQSSRRAAQAEQDAARDETTRLAASRDAALRAAEADAEAHKATLLAHARAEAAQLRAQAESEITRERAAQARDIEGDAVRLAVEIAGRLLDRMPAEARVQGFIRATAEALAKLPPETCAEFGTQGEPLEVAAPRALSAAERQACEAAFGAALGRNVSVRVRTDPTLIAGLELTGAHAEVRNHLRHDLDAIRETLLEHGRVRG